MQLFSNTSPIAQSAHKLELLVRSQLWLQVLIGMLFGVGIGLMLGPNANVLDRQTAVITAQWLALPGDLFLRLIKMILIPLVFFSILRGLGGSNVKDLASIGPKFLVYLLCTTTIASSVGLLLANIIQPGKYVSLAPADADTSITLDTPTDENVHLMESIPNYIVNVLPENPLASAMEGEMFSIVIFSLMLGVALAMQPNARINSLLQLFDDLLAVFMTIVKWAMLLAPLAVFGLTARIAAEVGMDVLLGMGMYVATVILGLVLLLLLYYSLVFLFKKFNPLEFAGSMAGLQLLAFSTSSSAAVMPASIQTATEKLEVDESTAEIIVPLGTTINMDGTALYQSIAVMFMAQVAGIELTVAQMGLVVLTLVASSIGSPGTPGVGVAILGVVASNLGIPTTGHALVIGVDRILDMCRTAVNVTGDLTACVIFDPKRPGWKFWK